MKQHYKDMPIEPFVLMERLLTAEEFIGFIKGSAIKYSLRAGRKEGSNDDAAKALDYLAMLDDFI